VEFPTTLTLEGAISMTIYYLYVKTHRITGLHYLGYTSKLDPHEYAGSGTRWNLHLKKHGYLYDTKILNRCISKSAIRAWGLFYSRLWSVVNSKKWANLKEENGDGGGCVGEVNGMYGKTHTDVVKTKLGKEASLRFKGKSYEELYGKDKADLLKKKRSDNLKGKDNAGSSNPMYGKKQTDSAKELQSIRAKNRTKSECPHCKKFFAPSPLARHHGNNCKCLQVALN
jgi:hypothetical protein